MEVEMAEHIEYVTLAPGQSADVGHTFTAPAIPGIHQVSADGLIGTFEVLEVLEAVFEVSNLRISPAQVYAGDPVTITVTVTNVGNVEGTYGVIFVVP